MVYTYKGLGRPRRPGGAPFRFNRLADRPQRFQGRYSGHFSRCVLSIHSPFSHPASISHFLGEKSLTQSSHLPSSALVRPRQVRPIATTACAGRGGGGRGFAPNIVGSDGISASNDRKGTDNSPILSVIVATIGLLDALDVGVKTGEPVDEEYPEGPKGLYCIPRSSEPQDRC